MSAIALLSTVFKNSFQSTKIHNLTPFYAIIDVLIHLIQPYTKYSSNVSHLVHKVTLLEQCEGCSPFHTEKIPLHS